MTGLCNSLSLEMLKWMLLSDQITESRLDPSREEVPIFKTMTRILGLDITDEHIQPSGQQKVKGLTFGPWFCWPEIRSLSNAEERGRIRWNGSRGTVVMNSALSASYGESRSLCVGRARTPSTRGHARIYSRFAICKPSDPRDGTCRLFPLWWP